MRRHIRIYFRPRAESLKTDFKILPEDLPMLIKFLDKHAAELIWEATKPLEEEAE
jgi:hypothetical protein